MRMTRSLVRSSLAWKVHWTYGFGHMSIWGYNETSLEKVQQCCREETTTRKLCKVINNFNLNLDGSTLCSHRKWFSSEVQSKLYDYLPNCQPQRALRGNIKLFIEMRAIWTSRVLTREQRDSWPQISQAWFDHKSEHLKWLSNTNLGED